MFAAKPSRMIEHPTQDRLKVIQPLPLALIISLHFSAILH